MQYGFNDLSFPPDLIGNSPEIAQLKKHLPVVGNSDEHVVIFGESGTERLAAAKIVLESSPRKDRPLVVTEGTRVNSALEQEVNVKFFEQGLDENNKLSGTLVLDSFEKLDNEAQNKLLPIAKKAYLKDPKSGEAVESDIRIIATASPVIQTQLEDGSFDSELFFVLSTLSVRLPALRDRKQDIPFLFEHYLKQVCQQTEREVPPVNFEVFTELLKHNWPGNLKELENTVRSMLVMTATGQELDVDSLPFAHEKEVFTKLQIQNLNLAISNLEKELITKTLRRFAGNQSNAARLLGVSETNLRYKMKKLGIKRRDFIWGKGIA
jgi:DNA-binding NtrC family response regulator